MKLHIDRTWDGVALPRSARAWVDVRREGHELRVTVDAPFAGDPAPDGPPGPTAGLWEHEVVELFLVGDREPVPYLEIELGPHGHHLVLSLRGVRQVVASQLPASFTARIDGDRWTGTATLDAALIPPGALLRVNAFAIRGRGEAREYHCANALPGPHPDFHQPARFQRRWRPKQIKPVLPLLARGAGWAVFDKPSGLAVHRNAELHDPFYALQLIRDQLDAHIHLVHRLDRGASGCLLVALDPDTTRDLQAAMTGPDARKEYLALCRGPWGRGPDPVDVTTPIPDGRGGHKEALTTVRCLGTDLDARSALLHAAPRTGRHHQVRRHCRDLNHPVLGDGQHGDTRVNRMFRDTHGLDRLALHAWRLALPLPSGERLSVTAPLPTDLTATLHGLPFWPEALAAEPELARSPAQV